MRKVDDGEKETNVVGSQPPERRPTGTPTARDKITTFMVATNVVAS